MAKIGVVGVTAYAVYKALEDEFEFWDDLNVDPKSLSESTGFFLTNESKELSIEDRLELAKAKIMSNQPEELELAVFLIVTALELFIQTLLETARLEFNRPEKGIMGKFGVLRHHKVISQNDYNTFKQGIKSIRNPVFHSSGVKVDREDLLSFHGTVLNFVEQYSRFIKPQSIQPSSNKQH